MGLTLLKLSSSCISEIIRVVLWIISGISLLPSLIEFLCAYCISPVIHWMILWTTTLTTSLWLALGPCPGFYSLCGLLGFPGTPRALRDNGPLPLLFYGFCGTYGPFPLGILRVMTAIGPLGHSMAPISFLRLRVTLLSAR